MKENLTMPVVSAGTKASSDKNILIAAKGGGIIFVGRLFDYATRFIFGIIVARALGADGYGLYALGITTSEMLATISRFGLSEGMVHFLPNAIQERDEPKIWGVLQVGLIIPTLIAIGAALVLYAFSEPIAMYVFKDPAASIVLRMTSIAIPFMAVGRVVMASMRGFKYMRYGVYADNIVFNVVRLGLTVLLLAMGWHLAGALGAYVIAWVITAGLSFYYLHRIFPLKRAFTRAQTKLRQLLSFSAPICLTQLVGQFRGSFELFMLGILSTMTTVGVYSVAIRVQAMGSMFLMAVEMVAKPIISELYHQRDFKNLSRFYQTLTRWSLAFVFPFFISVVLFANPILRIFGDEFASGALVLTIVSLGTLINGGTGICGAMVVMTGNSKLSFFNSLLTLVMSIILNLYLIPKWGLIGAAVAAALSYTFVNLLRLFEVRWLFKLWPYNREILKPVAASVIAFTIGFLSNRVVPADDGFLHLGFNLAILWSVYLGVILLLGLTDEDRMLLDRTKRRINKLRFGKLPS